MLPRRFVKTLERNYKNIGTLPTVVGSLIRILNNPKSSTKDLAKVISADKVLSTKLLKMVNSAYFGLRNEIVDVQQAISLVGYNVIRSFTFCITLFDSMFPNSGGLKFNKEQFWMHSLGVGSCSRRLATKLRLSNSEDYFVAGLVHDIGKVFMYQFLTDYFFLVLETVENENISFYEAERITINTDHTEIGAWIMEKWKLPELLIRTVQYHHFFMENHDRKVEPSMVITLADNIIKEMEIGFSGDSKLSPEYNLLKEKFRVDDKWIEDVKEQIKSDIVVYEDIILKKKSNITTRR